MTAAFGLRFNNVLEKQEFIYTIQNSKHELIFNKKDNSNDPIISKRIIHFYNHSFVNGLESDKF
mgnify:CR=1 FL=1